MNSIDENTSDLLIDETINADEIVEEELLDEDEEDDEDFDPNNFIDEEEDEDEPASSAADPASEHQAEDEDLTIEEEVIPKRTRSNYKIDAHNQEPLEFPDFSEELYAPNSDDPVYASFLNGLFADDLNDLNGLFADEDENDPEYELQTTPEARPEKISVPKSEINKLLDESLTKMEICKEPDIIDWTSVISDEHRQLIKEQMAQHVQLLTQNYMLSTGDNNFKENADMAKLLLNEVKWKAGNNPNSLFNTLNLDTALTILEEKFSVVKQHKQRKNDPKNNRRRPLSDWAMNMIVKHPQAFPYAELLPACGLYPPDSKRPKFTEAEDYLIALGLQQFADYDRHLFYIQQLLVPVRTVDQIKLRLKNISQRPDNHNPLSMFMQELPLPPAIGISTPLTNREGFDPETEKLPLWLEKHLAKEERKRKFSNNKSCGKDDDDQASTPKETINKDKRLKTNFQPNNQTIHVISIENQLSPKPWSKEEDLFLLKSFKNDQLDINQSLRLICDHLKRDPSSCIKRLNHLAQLQESLSKKSAQ